MQINQLCTFECTVKTKGYQTQCPIIYYSTWFESTVKTKGYQTLGLRVIVVQVFESAVSS